MATIREPTGDDEYRQLLDLRWRILRAPWGQPRGSEADADDEDAVHLAVYDDSPRMVAAGRLHRQPDGDARIRYMAVEVRDRGQGFGGMLLAALEERARALGLCRVVLDARTSVLPFYLRFGYRDEGSSHTLFGEIEHHRMSKELNSDGT